MEAEYYTPELDEFHVGFEYQYMTNNCMGILDDTLGEWVTEEFSCSVGGDGESELRDIEWLLGKQGIRVKHLDRKDIESLGWKDIEDNFFELFNNGLIHKILLVNGNVWIYFKQNVGNEKIVDKTLFFGKIKNKSELKKIMVQTGILEK